MRISPFSPLPNMPFLASNDPRFGIVGDGVVDDTDALVGLLARAKTENATVYLRRPSAYFKITEALPISRRGQVIIGENPRETIIRQTTAGEHLFTLVDDTDDSTRLLQTRIEHLRLEGVGKATATGYGIHAAYKAGVYNGDFFQMLNCEIEGFAIGAYFDHWAQTKLDTVFFRDNGVNFKTTGNSNTFLLVNCANTNASTIGFDFGDGWGNVVQGGDHGNQPNSITVRVLSNLSIVGGNFESADGSTTAFIDVEANGNVVSMAPRFLKGNGAEVPAFRVAGAGRAVIIAPTLSGFSSPKVVKKSANNAIVRVIATDTSQNTTLRIDDNSATTYPHAEHNTVADNGVATATANYRGAIHQVMGRDSANVEDRLLFYKRRRDGTYNYVDLTDPKRFYSTNGGSTAHAREDGANHFDGRITFTTAAAAYTDVTVNIGAYSSGGRRSFQATVANTGQVAYAVRASDTYTSGDIVFRVHHPSDTGGGLSWELHYSITVKV